MLILILSDTQYSQNAAFSFERFEIGKLPPPPPNPYRYLENPEIDKNHDIGQWKWEKIFSFHFFVASMFRIRQTNFFWTIYWHSNLLSTGYLWSYTLKK